MNASALDTSTASEGIRLSAMTLQQSEHRLRVAYQSFDEALRSFEARLPQDCVDRRCVSPSRRGRARCRDSRKSRRRRRCAPSASRRWIRPGNDCVCSTADTRSICRASRAGCTGTRAVRTVDVPWRRTETTTTTTRRRRMSRRGRRSVRRRTSRGSRRRSRRDGERGARSLTRRRMERDGGRGFRFDAAVRRSRGDAARPFVGSTGQRTENRVQRQMGRDAGRGFGASVARESRAGGDGYERVRARSLAPAVRSVRSSGRHGDRGALAPEHRRSWGRTTRRATRDAKRCVRTSLGTSSRCATLARFPNLPAVAEDSDSDEWETDDEHEVDREGRVVRRRRTSGT